MIFLLLIVLIVVSGVVGWELHSLHDEGKDSCSS